MTIHSFWSDGTDESADSGVAPVPQAKTSKAERTECYNVSTKQ